MKKVLLLVAVSMSSILFGQIERVDTLISNPITDNENLSLDLDGDGGTDLSIQNTYSPSNMLPGYSQVWYFNYAGHFPANNIGSQDHGITYNCVGFNDENLYFPGAIDAYSHIQGPFSSLYYHIPVGTYNIPLRIEKYDNVTQTWRFKYVIVEYTQIDDQAPFNYEITGWYINQRWDEGISCDSDVNDSIIAVQDYTIDSQSVCDSLIWIDGNTYTSSTNTPTFTTTDVFGNDSTIQLHLTITPTPIVDAGPDVSICEGEEFIFTPTNPSGDALSYYYDSIVDSPSIGFITYAVFAIGQNGCNSSDEMILEIVDCTASISEINGVKEDGLYQIYDLNGKVLDPNSLPSNQLLLRVYESGRIEKFIMNK